MKKTELRQKGYQALINALGTVETIEFLQQLDIGYGDYTQERYQWLDQLTFEDFENYLKEKKEIIS